MSIDQTADVSQTATPTVTVTAAAPIKAFSDDDGPSFKDVLDIINPLQHIPIINTIYRHLTGDEEGAVADVGGGALYAGPVGIIASMVDLAVKAESGKSIGDNILSWLGMGEDNEAPSSQAAQTAQAAQNPQQVQQVQQQQVAATAPLTAITAQNLSPLPARPDRKDARDSGKDAAPAKVGEFMVFGGAGNAAPAAEPVSLTPPAAVADAAGKDASQGPKQQGNYLVFGGESQSQSSAQQQQPASATVASADQAATGRQGDYMVFGAPVAAQTSPAAAAAAYAAAPMSPASASVTAQTPAATVTPAVVQAPAAAQHIPAAATAAATATAVANMVPPGGGPATLSPLPARNFAVPARRTQTAPTSLPVPTTGPAAVAGHTNQSQAISAMKQGDADWFSQAVNSGLDKYAAAQKLAEQNATNTASTAADSFATIH